MKKFALSVMPLICASMVLPLYADMNDDNNTQNQSMPSSSDQQDSMNDQQQTNGKKNWSKKNMITPDAAPHVTHWADGYFTADFIWWKAYQENMDFAYTGVLLPGASTSPGKGRFYQPGFKFEPGFKVGAGLKFRHDGWDFYGQYTWLRVHATKHVHAPDSSQLFFNIDQAAPEGAFGYAGSETSLLLDEAKGRWNLHMNVLDFELGRKYCISRRLKLRPFAGMKFSWNPQHFHASYELDTAKLLSVAPFSGRTFTGAAFKFHQDQFGVGLRGGMDTTWYFVKHWSFYGDIAFTALWNDFNLERKDVYWSDVTDTAFTGFHAKKTNLDVTGVIEMEAGFRFDTTFCEDDLLFFVQAGWEEQIWFDQNQFLQVGQNVPSNLNFQGFNFKTGIYF